MTEGTGVGCGPPAWLEEIMAHTELIVRRIIGAQPEQKLAFDPLTHGSRRPRRDAAVDIRPSSWGRPRSIRSRSRRQFSLVQNGKLAWTSVRWRWLTLAMLFKVKKCAHRTCISNG